MPRRLTSEQRPVRYPKIAGPTGGHDGGPCVAFEKLDGSNLQFTWGRQAGWLNWGTRRYLLTGDHPLFGPAKAQFDATFAGPLGRLFRARDYKHAPRATAFCEWAGPRSFAGRHEDGDPMRLVLFDLLIGDAFLPPDRFRDESARGGLAALPTARVVHEGPFDAAFRTRVRAGEAVTGEGVVAKGTTHPRPAKAGRPAAPWTAKVKTASWLAELAKRAEGDVKLKKELAENTAEQA